MRNGLNARLSLYHSLLRPPSTKTNQRSTTPRTTSGVVISHAMRHFNVNLSKRTVVAELINQSRSELLKWPHIGFHDTEEDMRAISLRQLRKNRYDHHFRDCYSTSNKLSISDLQGWVDGLISVADRRREARKGKRPARFNSFEPTSCNLGCLCFSLASLHDPVHFYSSSLLKHSNVFLLPP